ncbi:MAG: hypothetical protein WCT44_04015 [Candidatus Paceibacterota bacterium]
MHKQPDEETPLAQFIQIQTSTKTIRRGGGNDGKINLQNAIASVQHKGKLIEIPVGDVLWFRLNRIKDSNAETKWKTVQSTAPSEVRLRFLPSGEARIDTDYWDAWFDRISALLKEYRTEAKIKKTST